MRRSMVVAATLVAGSLLFAGCGSNSLDDSGSRKKTEVNTSTDDAAAAKVPAALKEKGTITVGTDASYAPNEFFAGDGKTIQGFDVDLFTAVAKTMGLKVQFQNAGFDTIITGVQGKKYDVGVSSFTINAEREKQVTMVSYFNAGTQWAAAKGKGADIDTDKPCGLTVAVQKGTVQQEEDLPSKIAACKKAGKPVKVLVYTGQDQVTAAVVSGKADAMLADSPVVAYAVKQSKDKLDAAGEIYDAAPYGFVMSKANAGLGDAIVLALKKLKSDGTYDTVAKNWGVQQGQIDDFAVNPQP